MKRILLILSVALGLVVFDADAMETRSGKKRKRTDDIATGFESAQKKRKLDSIVEETALDAIDVQEILRIHESEKELARVAEEASEFAGKEITVEKVDQVIKAHQRIEADDNFQLHQDEPKWKAVKRYVAEQLKNVKSNLQSPKVRMITEAAASAAGGIGFVTGCLITSNVYDSILIHLPTALSGLASVACGTAFVVDGTYSLYQWIRS